jgi:hypothetical protein
MVVRLRFWLIFVFLVPLLAWSQQQTQDQNSPGPNQPLPRSGPQPAHDSTESSSRDTIIDLSPPPGDAKDHPNSIGEEPEDSSSDVKEFHPFDPHRAMKDVEVGDFYLNRRNYNAAISRYREALLYKPDDALATWGLAEALDKAGKSEEARSNYEAYLKILPYGPKAPEAHQALERLKGVTSPNAAVSGSNPGDTKPDSHN